MSTAPLMVTFSGIRGIAHDSLTQDVIIKYVKSFITTQLKENPHNSKFVVGRDSRISGPWAEEIVIQSMKDLNCEIYQCGIVPTPTVQVMVEKYKANGGIIITSSHNPKPWNGLKFVDSNGLFIYPSKCSVVFKLADEHLYFKNYDDILHFNKEMNGNDKETSNEMNGNDKETSDKMNEMKKEGKIIELKTAKSEHLDSILNLPFIDIEKIRKKHFKVVLDSVCGAGGPILIELLKRLNCEIIELNTEPTGDFPHIPEPLPENLIDLCTTVKETKADIGIAVDPDVDRCVLIANDGNPIGEEYTLVSAVYFILKWCKKEGNVCKNLSSSRATSVLCEQYNSKCYNTPVGEIQVALGMIDKNAIIGGEGNGGVMLPDVHIGRDAMVASTLVLMLMSLENKSLREIVDSLPQFKIYKTKIEKSKVNNLKKAFDLVKEMYKNEEIDERDGLYVSTKDFWVHLRVSNTEPIVRVISEAENMEKAKEAAETIMNILISA